MSQYASSTTVEADVIDSEVIDESLLRRLLQKTGRTIAGPALEALEMASAASSLFLLLVVGALVTFWAERICILIIFIFETVWDSRFPDSWISRLSAGMSPSHLNKKC